MDAAAPMISSIRPLRSRFSALCTSDFHTTSLSAGFSFISFHNWRFRTLTVRNSSSSYSGEKIIVPTSSELRQKKASTERKPDEKLASLRRLFSRADIQLDAYIVPSQDAHQSEFIADCFTRRAYLTGFTGSAGTAVVTHDKAALWTDGRYFLQAQNQLSHEWTLMKTGNPGVPTTTEWLFDVLTKNGSKVGIDPFLFPSAAAEELKEALSKKNHELIYMHNLNLVDEVWGDSRPEPPTVPIRIHDIKYAGSDITSKLSSLQSMLLEEGADGIAISMLDEVAWLLNLRGSDVPHSPVVYSYVVVERGSTATLFVDQRKVTPEVATYLKNAGVSVKPYEVILSEIGKLAGQGKKIWLDTSSMNAAIVNAYQSAYLRFKELGQKAVGNRKATTTDRTVVVGGHEGIYKVSPISLQKAIKNEAELEGMRQSHLRDAAALAEFWAWLEEEIHNQVSLTEVDVSDKLLQFRAKQHGFLDTSFDTISGYGPNGAIIHYKPEAHSCRCLDDQKLFLLDSGAQYVDGTTDVTRTVHFGKPSSREKECFTRVLQGHISLDQAVFPENTPGFVLDVLARSFLWKIGLDYRHGTGHGVGAALNVHEGPQSISYRYGNMTSLYKGMVVSNEPGYYEDHSFGIRIENLLVVKEVDTPNSYGGVRYFGFEKLTYVPIQGKLIELSLMSPSEIEWVNQYHAEVWEKVSPHVEAGSTTHQWLYKNTRPLGTPS